ncbi:hypothetical protein BpHYR1_002355 [Brachionus plicatilis]|uniref:Uncharacterized protein n=1 Tax=Brachionus plicatilis TaxID=10195 RepID=A0A3M7Q4V5_BRAPC|nr:hypothetical protein BpHYR1_002355 [Brachionus plicatilis]
MTFLSCDCENADIFREIMFRPETYVPKLYCRIGLEYEVKKIVQNREISIRATVLIASANRNVFRHEYMSQNTNFSSNLQENILENTQLISLVPQSSVSLNNSQTQFVNFQQYDLAINQQTPKSLNIPGCEGQQTASSNHVSIDLMQHESNNNLNHDMQNESLDIHKIGENFLKILNHQTTSQKDQLRIINANFSTSETTLLRISNNTENMMRNFDSQTVVQRKVLEQLESLNKNMHVVNEVEIIEKNTETNRK